MKYHITENNGYVRSAKQMINAMNNRKNEENYRKMEQEYREERQKAELQYYEDNHCYPRPLGYFGTETDAHLYER